MFKLLIERFRLKCKFHCILNRPLKGWNSLPSDVVSRRSLEILKSKIIYFDLSEFCQNVAPLCPRLDYSLLFNLTCEL